MTSGRGPQGRRRGEGGAALVLALAILLGVSAFGLALLSISAVEPQISRNHADAIRARYLAEAGLEHAYALLARSDGSWDAYLSPATCTRGAVLAESPLPGMPAVVGAVTVTVRNDCADDDRTVTGVQPDAADPGGRDTNHVVIVEAVAAVRGARHAIRVALSYNAPASGQTVPASRLTPLNWTDTVVP